MQAGVKPESLQPTPQEMAKGPSFPLSSPIKFPLRVGAGQITAASMIQPVLVHATIDRKGRVIEAEALQNSNRALAARAIEVVKSRDQGRSRVQREVFVNVEFMVASSPAAGGK